MVTELTIIYQDVRSQPIFLSLTLIRTLGYFFILSSQVHQEMFLPHVLGHYSVNFIARKQQNKQNNLLRSISLDLRTLTKTSVWIHIQSVRFLKLSITFRSTNFQKFYTANTVYN